MEDAARRGLSLPTPSFCHLPGQEAAAHSPPNPRRWLQRCREATPSTTRVSPCSCSAGLTLPQHRKTVNPTSPPASPSIRPLWAPSFTVQVQLCTSSTEAWAGSVVPQLWASLSAFPLDAQSHPPTPSVETGGLFSQDLGEGLPRLPSSQHSNRPRGSFAAALQVFIRNPDLVKSVRSKTTRIFTVGNGTQLVFRSPRSGDRGQQPRSRPPLTTRSLSFGNACIAYQ